MGAAQTIALFGSGALLLFVATHVLIPALAAATGVEPIVWWFVTAGLLVFAPLLVVAVALARGEAGAGAGLGEMLRLAPPSRADWAWAFGALLAIAVLTGLLQAGLAGLTGSSDLEPSFMSLEPLGPGRYWILGAWLPFWSLNIMGEELLWRGVVLPRQEAAFGRAAWVANGFGWLLFHVAFGWRLLVVLLPILFILPYAAQRRRNTWVGVIIHAGLNGPGFIAVAFGLG